MKKIVLLIVSLLFTASFAFAEGNGSCKADKKMNKSCSMKNKDCKKGECKANKKSCDIKKESCKGDKKSCKAHKKMMKKDGSCGAGKCGSDMKMKTGNKKGKMSCGEGKCGSK